MGDRRLVTIIFADLASFTATSEKADPEDVIDMLNYVFNRLAAEYEPEGGYLDKIVGDQLMILFGAPRAHEDDPARAVRVALGMAAAMEELAPEMRKKVGHAFKLNIGINTGTVVWGRMGPAGRMASTVIGDHVNLASRLEHFATNGQIIVSDAVYSLTQRYFDYEILDPIKVKGKTNPISIYMPTGPKQAVQAKKSSREKRTPLVERDKEQQTLHAHLSYAVSGQGRIVLINGEAGMGKSRLLAEFLRELENYRFENTPTILQTYGGMGSSSTYSPLKEFLAQLFSIKAEDSQMMQRRKIEDRARMLGFTDKDFIPLMGYLMGWYQGDERLTDIEKNIERLRIPAIKTAAILTLKQSSRRPLIITIDNLQWADTNSLEWLKLLGATVSSPQHRNTAYDLLILAATRPQIEIPLETFQAKEIVLLQPLSTPARRDMILSLLPGGELPSSLVDRLIHESGGNPFYLEEAARGLVQSEQLIRRRGQWYLTKSIDQIYIPHSIEGQVMAHLDMLDNISRMVLQHASVIGMNFNYNLLQAITPVAEFDRAIENLKQRALITELIEENDEEGEPERHFTFLQMVVREVAYRSMLKKSRRDLHEQIIQLTESDEPVVDYDEESVEALARHYMAGGSEEKIVIYNWLVGQKALDNFNFGDACQHLQVAANALKEVAEPDPNTSLQVLNALGDANTFVGKFDQAASCYQLVWEMVKNNPKELVKLYYRIGRLNFYQGNLEAAAQSYQYAENIAKERPDLLAQMEADTRLMYDLI